MAVTVTLVELTDDVQELAGAGCEAIDGGERPGLARVREDRIGVARRGPEAGGEAQVERAVERRRDRSFEAGRTGRSTDGRRARRPALPTRPGNRRPVTERTLAGPSGDRAVVGERYRRW